MFIEFCTFLLPKKYLWKVRSSSRKHNFEETTFSNAFFSNSTFVALRAVGPLRENGDECATMSL